MAEQTGQLGAQETGKTRPLNPYARQRQSTETPEATPSPVAPVLQRAALPGAVIAFLICLVIPATFAVGPVVLSLMRIVLIAGFFSVFAAWAGRRAGRILPTDIFLVLFCSWVLLSMLVRQPGQAIEFSGINFIECFGAYLFGRVFIRSEAQFVSLVKWLGFIILSTIPLAIYEAATGVAVMSSVLKAIPFVGGPFDAFGDVRLGLQRVQGPFETAIHYGLFCAVGFVLLYKAGPSNRKKFSTFLWTSITLVGTFLSLSTGPLFAIVVQLGLLIWNRVFRKWSFRWQALVALVVLAYVAVDTFSARPPINVFLQYATMNTGSAWWRVGIFNAGVENIQENPIFGLGLGDWKRPAWMHSASVDNFWLLVAMRHGLPALILVGLAFISAVLSVSRAKSIESESFTNIRYAWTFLMVSLIVTLITVHIWTSTYSLVFFILGSGMWMAQLTPQAQTGNTAPETTTSRRASARGGSVLPAGAVKQSP